MVPDRAVKQYANPPPRRSAKPRRGPPLDRVRSHLREADPVLARLIDARPTFDPQGWMAELRAMDLFGALLFQVAGRYRWRHAPNPGAHRDAVRGSPPSPAKLLGVPQDSLRQLVCRGEKSPHYATRPSWRYYREGRVRGGLS